MVVEVFLSWLLTMPLFLLWLLSSSSGEGEVMVEDSLGLVVWVILGTQHLETALELINVERKILTWEYERIAIRHTH